MVISLCSTTGRILIGCQAARLPESASQLSRAVTPPQPISMAALHGAGGVPAGWTFMTPPGDPTRGRQAFMDFGCFSCHAVQGEHFPGQPGEKRPGPDLTGMGGHHPAGYFAESILNPDAVLVDGPGYLGSDGRSIMPSYPDMTLAQLTDLVAYLKSLDGGGNQGPVHAAAAAPEQEGSTLLIRMYRVTAAQLTSFADWFEENGAQRFGAMPGLLSFTSYINHERSGRLLVTVYEFEDEGALFLFLRRPESPGDELDRLLGGRTHAFFRSAPLYPATGLSWP
jgi:hypothetical protein